MTPHRTIFALLLTGLTFITLPAQAEDAKAEETKTEEAKPAEEAKAEEAKPAEDTKAEEAKPAEETKAEEAKPAEETKAEEGEAAAPAEGEAAAAPAEPEPTGWWTPDAREAEAKELQAIFNEMPKPEKRKGAGRLIYPRHVPLVVGDIHNTTAAWGSKLQPDVHYVGISKVHTTSRLEAIGRDTPGIPFCPLACNRITDIFPHDKEITIQYDGPIQDWAGKAADNNSGYSRRFGKPQKAKCSFPLMYPDKPKDTYLDEETATKVRDLAIAEIKRYCADK